MKKTVFFILHFSQNQFFSQNQAVSPLFLQDGWADRAQLFFIATLVQLGCVFFFTTRSRLYQIWEPLENLYHRKNKLFDKVFGFLLLLTYVFNILRSDKKYTPRLGST
jgi:hypothetical protein